MAKKLRKKKTPKWEEGCTYIIEIIDWEIPYSFSLNHRKIFSSGPFREHTSLNLTGRIIQPENLKDRTIPITMIGDRDKVSMVQGDEKYLSFEPKCVGTLTIRGAHSDYLGSLPFDVLPTLCFLLQAGKIKILALTGKVLYRGTADITSVHFEKEFISEDWM